MSDTDLDVIEKVQKGDTSSFRLIVEKYKDKAYSLALKILKDESESEDAVQESFLKVFRSVIGKQFEGKAKFSTYFYSIVYNTAVDAYKKNKHKSFNIVSIDIEDSVYRDGDELTRNFGYQYGNQPNQTDTGSEYTKTEVKEIVNRYLNSIPEHYTVILNMYYVNGLAYAEIGNILKIPEGTVKNRLFRAKEKLRELIVKYYPEEELTGYV